MSFTTTAQLAPGDTNRGPDVYVRDMDRPVTEAGAFTLASAVDGSQTGLSYGPAGASVSPFEEMHYGSLASGRSALSADGREVVFVTTAVSRPRRPGDAGAAGRRARPGHRQHAAGERRL